jgi:hypothetical protein
MLEKVKLQNGEHNINDKSKTGEKCVKLKRKQTRDRLKSKSLPTGATQTLWRYMYKVRGQPKWTGWVREIIYKLESK